MSGTDAKNAKCLVGTAETKNFEQYVASCRTTDDTRRANNLFSPSIADFTATFDQYRAEYDNLIVTGDSVSTMADLTGGTTNQANQQLNEVTKKKDMLLAEIKAVRSQVEAIDRGFLDSIMQGVPSLEKAPTLQDWGLLLFFFSWFLMGLTLVGIRYASEGGGLKPAGFTFLLYMLVTIFVYSLIQQVG
jgi:hypothetical protein